MKWGTPPIIKVYEALGAVADGRIEVSGDTAKVYSSSRGKYYDVKYDPAENAIMANDNGSYWMGYLGYPAISYLLATGVLEYKEDLANLLKDIKWKDINQNFKNDFDKALEYILDNIETEDRAKLVAYVEKLLGNIEALNLLLLGTKAKPPEGY